MDTILQWIGNPDNSWIPIVTFLSISLIGGLVGYMNGMRTALYFLGWNLVGLVALVFSMPIAVNIGQSMLGGAADGGDFDASVIIEIFLEEYGAIVMAVWLMVGLFVLNIIAFLVYFAFRGKLKAKMKEDKMLGQSIRKIRWTGAGVGVLTAIPFTAAVTTVGTMTTTSSFMTKTNSGIFQGVTMGQVNAFHSGEDVATIFEVINMATSEDLGDGFMGAIEVIISGQIPDNPEDKQAAIDAIKDAKTVLEDMLENDLIIDKILPEMVKGLAPEPEEGEEAADGVTVDAATPPSADDLKEIFMPDGEDLRLEISKDAQDAFRKSLQDIISFEDENGNESTQAEIDAWIDALFEGIINTDKA